MKETNGSEDWRVLCELASKEKDPKKMLELVTKINQALEEFRRKPHSPASANAHFYSDCPGNLADISVRSLVSHSATGICVLVFAKTSVPSSASQLHYAAGMARRLVYTTAPEHLFAA